MVKRTYQPKIRRRKRVRRRFPVSVRKEFWAKYLVFLRNPGPLQPPAHQFPLEASKDQETCFSFRQASAFRSMPWWCRLRGCWMSCSSA